MRATWRLGLWRGIPISLHWTVFLGILWFLYQTRSLLGTAIAFFGFCFLLLAHELGHAAVALWRGVAVDEIDLYFLHGSCRTDAPDYELDAVLIAWGGVAAQFVVLVVALVAEVSLEAVAPAASALAWPLFRVLIATNLFIIVFNLLPVRSFDGERAWRILPILAAWAKETSWANKL